MRILELHCDYVKFKPRDKALKTADALSEDQKKEKKLENVLVVFSSFEEGDDGEVVKQAAEQIKKNYGEVKAQSLLVYPYAHLSSNLARPTVALELLDELFKECSKFASAADKAPFGYYKEFELKCKGHPLAELSKTINKDSLAKLGATQVVVEKPKEVVSQSLVQESQTKSVFFILTEDGKLHNPKTFDYSKHPDLKKFADYEISKVRTYAQEPPHIKLMKDHQLVNYEPASDSGHFRWAPKGLVIKKLLEKYVTNILIDYGTLQVETPIMYDYAHPALEKYLNRFPARQYTVKSDDKEYFLRFAACFGQMLMAHDMTISHKQLPLKIYELTHYSFRREQSGELAGIKRLRCFTMPDMHTLCSDFSMAREEFERQYNLCVGWNNELGISFETAFRAQKDFFEEHKDFYLRMVKKIGKPILLELFDQRYAYFITKFEMNFIDNANKATGMSTVQIDVENGERFDLNYTSEDGTKKHPIVLHASIPGAVERVVYALLEKYAMEIKQGKAPSFPLWLAPTQVRLVPVSDKQNAYCEKLLDELRAQNVRVDFDDRTETLQKKIRDAEKEWVSLIAVIGEKEQASGKLAVRFRGHKEQKMLSSGELIKHVRKETEGKPFEQLALPTHISKRPIIV